MNNLPDLRIQIGRVIGISMPTLLLALALATLVWFFVEIKRKRVQLKSMITWLVLNCVYTLAVIYIFIVQMLQIFGYVAPNLFSLFAFYVFGLELPHGMEWVFLWIFGLLIYILIKTLVNYIRLTGLDQRIDYLNQELAILKGKVNRTADFAKIPLTVTPLTPREVKLKLKDRLRKMRAEVKIEKQIQSLEKRYHKKSINSKKNSSD
ncbi:DUF2304 domain-containing protein [Mycoplasma sp. ATU-Cv-703]|uniref:DUF2304 domain-containing protein n=1 Tax=Mycoplasma sp. ATU-Cv-703 TaxID=2498595 RepID=UPI000FDD8D98